MAVIHDLPCPDVGKTFTYLFLSDIHSHYCDKQALKSILRTFQLVPMEQRRIILGGDILDCEHIYAKSQVYKDRMGRHDWDYFIEKTEAEGIWFDELYDILRKHVLRNDHIVFMEGNHEQRYRRDHFLKKIPLVLKHNFNLRSIIKADSRGLRVFDYNEWVRLKVSRGVDLYITHGIYCGANPIKKHYLDVKRSVLFGHTHEIGIQSFKDAESTIIGYNNPCLCDTEPDYLEGRAQNWSVGATFINQTATHIWVHPLVTHQGAVMLPTGEMIV
ncbi:MAG: hypothetical protein V3R57_06370 [Candidatus Bathyarchaeia archaeon]